MKRERLGRLDESVTRLRALAETSWDAYAMGLLPREATERAWAISEACDKRANALEEMYGL